MKLVVELDGLVHEVVLRSTGLNGVVWFSIDGGNYSADVVKVKPRVYSVLMGGHSFEIRLETTRGGDFVHINGHRRRVLVRNFHHSINYHSEISVHGHREIVSPMPGKLLNIMITVGDKVQSGQNLLIVEAMKMQNEIRAPKDGVIKELPLSLGSSVSAGDVLAVME